MRKTIRIWEFILLDSIKLLSDKVLGKIKMIKGIQKFDCTKILFNTDDKLADEVTLLWYCDIEMLWYWFHSL